ncbi:MAG: hypothetical protein BRD30_10850 [Bacteroidetes bacterium QH_2_63_10]|nr:MAG: hypothetical protein BRD30_10850 [Bacteroidetes bacterium QH_2_63_10]
MGQQQLLLLVLGIVIVGLAVVAGISAFEDNQQKSEKDALVNEGMRIGTDVMANYKKPEQLGGGGEESYPSSLKDVGYDVTGENSEGSRYDTPWGNITYDSDGPTITLRPKSSSETAEITFEDGSPSLASGGWSDDSDDGGNGE